MSLLEKHDNEEAATMTFFHGKRRQGLRKKSPKFCVESDSYNVEMFFHKILCSICPCLWKEHFEKFKGLRGQYLPLGHCDICNNMYVFILHV